MTRRSFAHRLGLSALAVPALTEAALAQNALLRGKLPPDTVFLNANENPEGPPPSAIEAMREVLTSSGRYHYQEFGGIYAAVARSEGFEPDQVLVGAGSTEILHCAVDVFTSPTRPLIYVEPTYETPGAIVRALGRRAIAVPQTAAYAADVKRMAAEAEKAGGGLIYICNPNNPTSAITTKEDIAWLAGYLPADTVLLVDEAYIHFSQDPRLESALRYVREGKDVIVARTFSKIYGMAGLRVGFGIAKPDFIGRMMPFRDNVISIVSARAAVTALAEAQTLVPQRRARFTKIRGDLCAWLKERNVKFIDPHANFLMIDVKRDVRQFIPELLSRGVAPGRPFPPMNNMLRVSIGAESDMEKFRRVFWEVYKA